MASLRRAAVNAQGACDLIYVLLIFGAFGQCLGCASSVDPLQALSQEVHAPPPDTVTLNLTHYQPQAGQAFTYLFVNNYSVKASMGQITYSDSRDSLSDALKSSLGSQYGFIVGQVRSNTAFMDLTLWLSGITLDQQASLPRSGVGVSCTGKDAITYTDQRQTTSPQVLLGLSDEEKQFLDLNYESFDTDGDGIPDSLEVRCGLNPLSNQDAPLDLASDGYSSLQKCQMGIPIDESYATNQQLAYVYTTTAVPGAGRTLSVSNIPVLYTGRENFIAMFIVETQLTTQTNSASGAPTTILYTAFAILSAGQAGQVLEAPYWNLSGSTPNDQGVVFTPVPN